MTNNTGSTTDRRYGAFPGIVVSVDGRKDNDHPEIITEDIIQKVRIRVAGIDPPDSPAEILPDVIVCYPVAGGQAGMFSPLLPGDEVMVMCINGETDKRIVVGRYYPFRASSKTFSVGYPYREGYISRGQHGIIFDNRSPNEGENDDRDVGVKIFTARGNTVQIREDKDDIQIRNQAGMRFAMRGEVADPDDNNTASKGFTFEGSFDGTGNRYVVKVDEEKSEIEITSKNGYTAVIRDVDAVTGTEKKGITLRTSPTRSIVIDEETGKMYINHDDEVVINSNVQVVINSNVQVNGKITATNDIESGGTVKDYFGDVVNTHQHTYVTPAGTFVTTPPITRP